MDWKKFLKPDWKKIGIFIIIFIVEILLISQKQFCTESICKNPLPPLVLTIFGITPYLSPDLIGSPFGFVISYYPTENLEIMIPLIWIPYWILEIVILYVLSCFIFWGYNKVKNHIKINSRPTRALKL